MWIKKTGEELTQEKWNPTGVVFALLVKIDHLNSIKGFLFIFIFSFALHAFLDFTIGIPTHSRFSPTPPEFNEMSLKDVPERLPLYIFQSILAGIIFLFVIRFRKKLVKSDSDSEKKDYVCEKCNRLKANDGVFSCSCGGVFIHIDKMKWVDTDP